MNSFSKSMVLLLAFSSAFAFSQSPHRRDSLEGLVQTEHNGWAADSLEHLVRASDVIVRARYGRLVNRELFYGYRETREEKAERLKITDEAFLNRLGIPQSEYEIHVDEVLMGDEFYTDAPALVMRVIESFDAPQKEALAAYREGEHLLFLTRNPDNSTYGLRGSMFDMKRIGNSYNFMLDRVSASAFGSGDSEEFLLQVEEEIAKKQQ
jgi:hypothetical protein